MLVKRYHAKDMQQAMDMVIRELGSDAIILNSRKVKQKGVKNLFQKPQLEVMVAYDPAKVPLAKKLSNAYSGYISPEEYAAETAAATAAVPAAVAASAEAAGYAQRPAQYQQAAAVAAYRQPTQASQILQAQQNLQNSQAALQQRPQQPPSHPMPNPIPGHANQNRPGTQQEGMGSLDDRISSLDNILNNFINRFSFVKRDITYDYSEGVEELFCRLVENQVREELAHGIARDTDTIIKRRPESTPHEVMEHLVIEYLGTPEPILPKKFKQQIILLVGPTGVGKTTTLVKLAANFAIKQKKRVGIINTDTYRIAAQQQLKTYADILSLPLSTVYQEKELEAAIEEMADREIIFIDTAGKRPGDEQHREDITKIIETASPEEVLLCVAAPTSFASLKEVVDTYKFIENYKFIVTKLDETRFRGMILNLCWYSKKTLAYVTTGQNVPDDIEVVDREALADQILQQVDIT